MDKKVEVEEEEVACDYWMPRLSVEQMLDKWCAILKWDRNKVGYESSMGNSKICSK